jgi:quinoprotein dehydrogenase-associated probable ABC transporter substrate-binding protein
MLKISIRRAVRLAALLSLAAPFAAHAQGNQNNHVLRVCADPDYLPFSNRAGEGFENKVAEVLAKSMGRRLEYHWASYRGQGGFSNFLADNLEAGKCDVVMDLPYGDNEAGYTNPYYTSSYVFISKASNGYGITSMISLTHHPIKIGYEEETTPETALKMLDLTQNAVVFHIADDPKASPQQFLQAVENNRVGVMITWEPAIGTFLKNYPDLTVTPVPTEEYGPGLPQVSYTYSMALGVRTKDTALKAALNKALVASQPQIAAILSDYNVKLYRQPPAVNFTNQ